MNYVHVKIAEVRAGFSGEILKATLGSCVGIAFYWRKKNCGGLAHCLLPEGEMSNEISARYVNQAIPALMHLLGIGQSDISQIEVSVAGGANMMTQLTRDNSSQVGHMNVESLRKNLKKFGFVIQQEDLMKDYGRQIILDCQNGNVTFINLSESCEIKL